ncbi:hypothetical protein [Falsirhodobacter sp. 20TX0035]|uniref:hypothetical protein n=1 Tax=Falsirhodobacter sp. 20TX0035 TaxID=3022019 RepID=UPI0023300A85|nr:hypothetical protein [Falsirhodobacter sp. 20TX0035]MDB6454764.1 hypothetical protein [Falsirhodobacter sp. 20TX0035]
MSPRGLRLSASLVCLLAHPALAQDDLPAAPGPRVLDTSSDFASGASEVLIDTPSALVWSTYQSGEKDGWYYRIFPDGNGILSRHPNFSRGVTPIRCEPPTGCRPVTPPPAAPVPATEVLAEMEGWVLRSGLPPAVAVAPAELAAPGASARPMLPAPGTAPEVGAVPGTSLATVTDWRPSAPAAPSQTPAAMPSVRAAPPRLAAVAPPPATAPTDTPYMSATPSQPAAAAPAPAVPRIAVPPVAAPSVAVTPVAARPATLRALRTGPIAPTRPSVVRRAVPAATSPPQTAAAAPDRFTCTLSGNMGLTYLDPQGGDVRFGKLSGTFGCSYRHSSGLNIRLSMTGYPVASQRSDSDASFSYALSYPLPGGYNLQYASYSAQFPRQPQSVINAFGGGGFRLSKSLPPLDMGKITGWDALGKLNCQGFAALTPGESPNGGFSCGLTAFGKFTFRATANVYSPGTQTEYQPDYSYSASYVVNDRVAIEYSNYAGNRFPWNSGGNSRGLASGALRVTYRFSF